jgi:hypothetical protein
MTRRSIFERMSEKSDFNFAQDLQTIRDLSESKTVVAIYNPLAAERRFTLEQFIDYERLIPAWKHHNRCIDCLGIKKKNGIDNLNFESPSIDEILTYLEYVANMVHLVEINKNSKTPFIKKSMSSEITYTKA